MAIEVEHQIYEMIPLDAIVSTLPVRRVSPTGLKRVQDSMERVGFLNNYPLVVTPCENGYQLIDGRHRYESAKALDLLIVPCVVKTNLTEQERYKLALESNSAAETVVPSTLVTYAEFISARGTEEYTQEKIAVMLGWSVSKVKNYCALSDIKPKAWGKIVTTFENTRDQTSEDDVTSKVTTVTITETLLRDILRLRAPQQFELVCALIHPNEKERISKGKFRTLAEAYRARNARQISHTSVRY